MLFNEICCFDAEAIKLKLLRYCSSFPSKFYISYVHELAPLVRIVVDSLQSLQIHLELYMFLSSFSHLLFFICLYICGLDDSIRVMAKDFEL